MTLLQKCRFGIETTYKKKRKSKKKDEQIRSKTLEQ